MSASLIDRSGSNVFWTIHLYSVDVARGLALLFGFGTEALVWGFLVKRFEQGGATFSIVSFFVLSECQFLLPDAASSTKHDGTA